MASVNRVIIGNNTIMDISDTTAEVSNVLPTYYFYDKNGDKVEGTCTFNSDTSDDTVAVNYVKEGVTFHGAAGGLKGAAKVGTVTWHEDSTPITLGNSLPGAKTAAFYNGITFHRDDTVIKKENIKNGITILGVEGTYEGEEVVQESKYIQAKIYGGSERFDTIEPDDPYTVLSKVEVGKIWYETSNTPETTGLTASIISLTKT